MHNTPYIFCYRCHSVVKPTKTDANYTCPSCGAAVPASHVERSPVTNSYGGIDSGRGSFGDVRAEQSPKVAG